MSHNLYFIPILAKALAADAEESLDKAFSLIERLRHQGLYTEGYRNFCRFMSESFAGRKLLDEQAVRAAMLNHVGSFVIKTKARESLDQMEETQSLRFKEEHEALAREFDLCTIGTLVPTIQVLCNGRELGQVSFPKRPGRRRVDEISPGHYVLKLDSGLVIREARLNACDLIWTQAHGERRLELAAETTEIRRQPTREIRVPQAAAILRTFAGLETGSLEIELTR